MKKILGLAALGVIMVVALTSKRELSTTSVPSAHPRTEDSTNDLRVENEAPKGSVLIKIGGTENKTVNASSLQNYLDPRLSHSERLKAWEEMARGLPHTLGQFYQASVAQNPYLKYSKDPHSYSGIRFGEEESFRLMALQVIEKEVLKDSNQMTLIQHVTENAQSAAVRRTAREMLPFLKKGKSYSLLLQQAMQGI